VVAQQDSRPQDWLDGYDAACDVAPVRDHTCDSTRDSCDEDWICSVTRAPSTMLTLCTTEELSLRRTKNGIAQVNTDTKGADFQRLSRNSEMRTDKPTETMAKP
jgi:hypothetical protein